MHNEIKFFLFALHSGIYLLFESLMTIESVQIQMCYWGITALGNYVKRYGTQVFRYLLKQAWYIS